MIDKKYTYGLIGASNNNKKYGNIIFNNLFKKGFKIIPINPNEKKIEGHLCYKDIISSPKIDVAIFVVPPNVTEKMLVQIKEKNIANVWMQPGSESKTAILFCKENNINLIYNRCIMVETK